MEAVFRTDRGKVRSHNEDNGGIFRKGDSIFVLVADGMGGHRAGDVASAMTLAYLQDRWAKAPFIERAEEAERWLTEQIVEVNRLLYDHAEQNEECKGMGTTLVAAVCTDRFMTIANIGDSRCYLHNETGFKQITEDHTLVNELVRTGQISKEDAAHHPRKNVIVRALGSEPKVEADIWTFIFEEGDMLLLCSDGLSNKVPEPEMIRVIESETNLEQKAEQLVATANENGGEDNITLVLVRYSKEESEGR
ncbi:MAG: Stp1/IreP family PP2C-type Ser/Thr phosphatase [Bacillus sp. (in: firmicutes)]